MAVQKLDDGRIVCSNASYIHITPWDSSVLIPHLREHFKSAFHSKEFLRYKGRK